MEKRRKNWADTLEDTGAAAIITMDMATIITITDHTTITTVPTGAGGPGGPEAAAAVGR